MLFFFGAGAEGEEVLHGTDDGKVLRLRMYRGNVQIYESRMDSLASHFMDANESSRTEFEEHRAQAFKEHTERSRHKDWRVDWGGFQHLIDEPRGL